MLHINPFDIQSLQGGSLTTYKDGWAAIVPDFRTCVAVPAMSAPQLPCRYRIELPAAGTHTADTLVALLWCILRTLEIDPASLTGAPLPVVPTTLASSMIGPS